MLSEHHQTLLEAFFSHMRNNLASKDVDALVEQHHIPSIFVNEGDKRICANKDEVRQQVESVIEKAAFLKAESFQCDLVQTIRLSEKIFFVQVKWLWNDAQNNEALRRITSYTLQEVEPDEFDVVVSVTDENVESA
jgi:hypothetical protein